MVPGTQGFPKFCWNSKIKYVNMKFNSTLKEVPKPGMICRPWTAQYQNSAKLEFAILTLFVLFCIFDTFFEFLHFLFYFCSFSTFLHFAYQNCIGNILNMWICNLTLLENKYHKQPKFLSFNRPNKSKVPIVVIFS